MSDSSVGVTPGSGKDIATYKVTEGGTDKEIQRNALNDAAGAPLAGQKDRTLSVPVTLSIQDIIELLKTAPAVGFVPIPLHSDSALSTPSRGIVVTAAGNLGVKLADGTDNNADLIAVTPGMQFPYQAVQKTSLNTAGFIGLK